MTLTWLMYWSLSPQPGRFVYPVGIKVTSYELNDGAHRLGADRPKLTQYADWWWHLLHGNFGHMWTGATLNDNVVTTAPIGPTLYPAIRETLCILIGGAILAVLISVPLGAIAGRRIGSLADKLISLGALDRCLHAPDRDGEAADAVVRDRPALAADRRVLHLREARAAAGARSPAELSAVRRTGRLGDRA